MQARRFELVDVLEGRSGLIAELDGRPVGLLTWSLGTDARGLDALASDLSGRPGERPGGAVVDIRAANVAEIRAVAVGEDARGRGIARALFEAAHAALAALGAHAAWLVTTNDNAPAIHLYESLGYSLVDTRSGAIDTIRRTIKPSIPLFGHDGVEMHDELEYAKELVAV
jgi:ribosomal protein S18 acetylase RimI-like enzyme